MFLYLCMSRNKYILFLISAVGCTGSVMLYLQCIQSTCLPSVEFSHLSTMTITERAGQWGDICLLEAIYRPGEKYCRLKVKYPTSLSGSVKINEWYYASVTGNNRCTWLLLCCMMCCRKAGPVKTVVSVKREHYRYASMRRRYAPHLDKCVSVEEPIHVILVVAQAGSDCERGDCNGEKRLAWVPQ